jgi:hypothetical protein
LVFHNGTGYGLTKITDVFRKISGLIIELNFSPANILAAPGGIERSDPISDTDWHLRRHEELP